MSRTDDADRLRLFCALDLPEEARAAITTWQRTNAHAAEAGGWRPVKPENLHLTLAFLGDQAPESVETVTALLNALDRVPIAATLRPDPVPLPHRKPRLVALELDSEGAATLREELASGLHAAGLLEPDTRPFWPHITVFRRSQSAARRASRGARIAPLEEGGRGHGHAFGFVRVALYRSENRPEGSSYSRLAARDLPRPSGNPEEVK